MQGTRNAKSNSSDLIRTIVAAHQTQQGSLLVILHQIQDTLGFIPDSAIPIIASANSLSRAEVQGVISFYPHFRTCPPGRQILEVCRAESCRAMGGQTIETHAKQLLGVEWHQTTADSAFTLEPVYCLGNCACSPSVKLGDEIYGRVSCDRLTSLIEQARSAT